MIIEAAGYIVYTNEAIFGTGETEEAAWAEAEKYLDPEPDDVDEFDQEHYDRLDDGSPWIAPATAALLAEVAERGGAISWGKVDSIHCTKDEEDAARE